jgi:hypothetical protein
MSEIQNIANDVMAKQGYKQIMLDEGMYAIKLLPSTQGIALALNLIRVFLPSIGAWADGEKKEGLILPEDNSMFSEVAMLLVGQMDRIDLSDVIKTLVGNTLLNNQPINFEEHFVGNYGTLIELVEFALKENFGSFFTTYLRKKGIVLGELMATSSASETPSAEMEDK